MGTGETSGRYRLDQVRRLASALGAEVGLAPVRALALADYLLWFDCADASAHGIRCLPDWIERIERRDVDPDTDGRLGVEHPGTVHLNGCNGIAPLVLSRAARVAAEKAREVGLGLVRVERLSPGGPTAPIAAEVAIGPALATILGPRPSWCLAIPTPEGLPAVLDTELEATPDRKGRRKAPDWTERLGPFLATLACPPQGWLIVVLAATALEPLTTFHERAASVLPRDEAEGCLLPGPWEHRRQLVREQGVALDPETVIRFQKLTERLHVEMPEPARS